jgi:hypothetical protein
VHSIGRPIPALRFPLRVVTVDDDVGGPYPPPSRDSFAESLRENGAELMLEEGDPQGEGTTVIALYGDIRAWKGRPGYSNHAKEQIRSLVETHRERGAVIVMFSHPRLAPDLGIDAPILCAWGGEAVMQRAAARVLLQSR